MDDNALKKACLLARQGITLLTVCDESGIPHTAAAGCIECADAGQVAVTDWFCPGIAANASPGKPISIVAWEPVSDTGHQLTGSVIQVVDYAAPDGYAPLGEKYKPLPQMQRTLIVSVDKIVAFCKAPHTDLEE